MISVHGTCGAWGVLAVADGTYPISGWNTIPGPVKGLLINGDWGQMGAQVIDLIVGFIWARIHRDHLHGGQASRQESCVLPEVEIEGLDVGEFGQYCYPDFVIKTETDIPLRGGRSLRDPDAVTSTGVPRRRSRPAPDPL